MDEKEKKHEVGHDQIIQCDISQELKECYIDYAMSVIVSRAIPDCRDGLKPVQRRILYSMKELGLTPNVKFKKSALVVGHAMGRYHPHGDMAIYDTLVRMAQPFSLRYMLVNGQGNFGCFTGDTKIRLTDGRNLSFLNLIEEQKQGKKHWGFAFNTEEKKIVITEILKPRKTKENQKLVEITLDNNEKIKCTLNHKFMNREGIYIEAQNLKEGDSLMPLYIDKYIGDDKNLKEYETILQPTTGKWDFVHQLADEWNLNNNIYEKSNGRIRHHIDFNKYNNNPTNIQRIQWKEHWELHKNNTSLKHKNDQEYVNKLKIGRDNYWSEEEHRKLASERMSNFNKKQWKNQKYREEKINSIKSLWQNPEMRAFFVKNSSENLKKLWNTEEFKNLMSSVKSKELKERWQDPEYRKTQSLRMKTISEKLWTNPEHRKYISELMKENGKQNQKFRFITICKKILLQYGNICEENYKILSKNYGGSCVISFKTGLEKYFNNDITNLDGYIRELVGTPINHKVKKVKFLKELRDVYDITTEPWHNFALASGVFVHNSIDGDPAAASRYTEARMMSIADSMFDDIEKDTVEFVPNYDNNLKEPKVLPTRVPQLLLNGTTGIAVGMATNIPPHNLGECMDAAIFLADNPNCDTDDLMQFVKGPDFPTGGTIYGWNEIKEAYSTGKGKVLIRGTAEIVESGSNNQIVITEIPYMVNKAELIKKIAGLIEDKKIINIKDIRDESDKKGLTITIDLKREANPKSILNQLYKYTDLEKYFHVNSISLIDDGLQPELLSLKDMLNEFISFRKTVIFRRTQFLLRKAKERLHILEGLKTALDHIDEIIDIIKKSENKEDANLKLCKKFKFTEIQANVILETKLQAIAKLEKIKIIDELKEKQNEINEYEGIIKDQKKIIKIMKEEFVEIKNKFSDERRTKLVKGMPDKIEDSELIPDENVLITLSQNGYIKRMNSNIFRTQQRGGKGITAYNGGDNDLLEHILNVSTKDNLLFFSDRGKVYQTGAYDINDASREAKGKAIQNFIDISTDENVTVVLGYNKEIAKNKKYLIMATKNGVIKKTDLSEFQNIRKNGLLSIKLDKDDLLKWADFSSGDDSICIVTKQGQSIMFSEKDVRSMGRSSSGVTGIKLGKDDEVVGMMVINKVVSKTTGSIVSLSQFGFGKKTLIKEYRLQKRGGTGIKNFKITTKTGLLVASKLANTEEILITISKKGLILQTELSDVPCLSRTTQGVKTMRLDEGDEVSEIVLL